MDPYPSIVCEHMKAFYDSLSEKGIRRNLWVNWERFDGFEVRFSWGWEDKKNGPPHQNLWSGPNISIPYLRDPFRYCPGASGSSFRDARSSRSQRIASTPTASSCFCDCWSENRETPITRRSMPAASQARRAMRDSVSPILPPAPRNMTSPSSLHIVSTTPSVGLLNICSSCTTSRIESRALFYSPIINGSPSLFLSAFYNNNA